MSTCNALVRDVTTGIAWASGKLYKTEKILTQGELSRKAERFHKKLKKTHHRPCVCAFQPSLTLTYSALKYILGNKKKRKIEYLLYSSVVLYPCYTHVVPVRAPSIGQIIWRPLLRVTRRLLFQLLLHRGVGEGSIPFPGLLHFTLDPYLIMLSAKQNGIKYHF